MTVIKRLEKTSIIAFKKRFKLIAGNLTPQIKIITPIFFLSTSKFILKGTFYPSSFSFFLKYSQFSLVFFAALDWLQKLSNECIWRSVRRRKTGEACLHSRPRLVEFRLDWNSFRTTMLRSKSCLTLRHKTKFRQAKKKCQPK